MLPSYYTITNLKLQYLFEIFLKISLQPSPHPRFNGIRANLCEKASKALAKRCEIGYNKFVFNL